MRQNEETEESVDGRSPVARLARRFELEPLDRDLFLGDPGPGDRRLFGGLVAAQSYMAAARTLETGERPLHSLHAYFLRPGRYELPIRYVVDRIRDGRSFTTRRVVAHQGGEAIFNLAASFARPEDGISHQREMPATPAPEKLAADPGRDGEVHPIEMRAANERGAGAAPSQRLIWMRPRGDVGDDLDRNTALLVYASDRRLLSTVLWPTRLSRDDYQMASLDHALWLHRPHRFDDWLLYASESPVASGARGLIYANMYQRDGTLIASVVQEGLVRKRR